MHRLRRECSLRQADAAGAHAGSLRAARRLRAREVLGADFGIDIDAIDVTTRKSGRGSDALDQGGGCWHGDAMAAASSPSGGKRLLATFHGPLPFRSKNTVSWDGHRILSLSTALFFGLLDLVSTKIPFVQTEGGHWSTARLRLKDPTPSCCSARKSTPGRRRERPIGSSSARKLPMTSP